MKKIFLVMFLFCCTAVNAFALVEIDSVTYEVIDGVDYFSVQLISDQDDFIDWFENNDVLVTVIGPDDRGFYLLPDDSYEDGRNNETFFEDDVYHSVFHFSHSNPDYLAEFGRLQVGDSFNITAEGENSFGTFSLTQTHEIMTVPPAGLGGTNMTGETSDYGESPPAGQGDIDDIFLTGGITYEMQIYIMGIILALLAASLVILGYRWYRGSVEFGCFRKK